MNCLNCPGTAGTSAGNNLVYLNKIYFDESQRSCPILFALATTPETFTQQLTFGQLQNSCRPVCGCSCCDFALTETTVFTVTSSHISINAFRLSPDSAFAAGDVTIDGFGVSDLVLSSGQYVADLSGIMKEISACPCRPEPVFCTCLPDDSCDIHCPDGHFFLAQVPGPWILNAAIILEGTASNGSRTCSFRLCMQTLPGSGDAGITIAGSDNFAMYCVKIPCQTAGITPTLVFDFDACASLLNPVLTVTGTGDALSLELASTLVITPQIHLKVTKPALFSLNATEVLQECDNVGQCDPCAQTCCQCDPCAQTCCQCGSPSGPEPGCGCGGPCGRPEPGCGCGGPCGPLPSAFQCCDTNGYSF